MAVHVRAKFIFQYSRYKIAAEVILITEQRRTGFAGRHIADSKQGVVAGADLQVLEGIERPGRAETNQVALLANPGLRRIAVEADFTPVRPAAPEHVKHFIVAGMRVVTREHFK